MNPAWGDSPTPPFPPSVQPYALPPTPNDFYGVQRRVHQRAGEAKAAQLLEGGQTSLLWRITANTDNGTFLLRWGTFGGTNVVRGLLSPLAISLPGAFTLQVEPSDPAASVDAIGSLSVSSGGLSVARILQTALGPISRYASRVQALAGATVSVSGSPIVLVAGQSLDVASPSVLTAGGPLLVELAV